MPVVRGGCLCGRVRYELRAPPIDAGYCHCRICQRSAGAPVLAWLTLAASDLVYVGAAPAVHASSHHARREFCAQCGTQLAFRPLGVATVDVTVASLDDPGEAPPEYHIFWASRIPWFEVDDRLPRHDGAEPAPEDPD